MAPLSRKGCAGLLVLALSMAAAAVQLQDTTFSMTFRVQKDQFDKALAETKELLKFAEEKKMSPNTQMFIRNARDKVDGALKEFAKRQVEEKAAEERKKGVAPIPKTLTDKEIGVKSLKGEAKKCNIKKHGADELPKLLAAGKVDLKKPFIVTGGMPHLDTLRRAFTSDELLKNTEVQLRYLSPVKAKEKRSFDQQQQQQMPDDEQLEYSLVTMDKYFMNCFNLKAKPDFRKNGGADTEHCEQTVAAALIHSNTTFISEMFAAGVAGELAFLQAMEPGRREFAKRASAMQGLVEKGNLEAQLQRSTSDSFTFGPAGSGEQLRQEQVPFADALVHGKRRWFLMAPKDFVTLREKAKDVLEPGSAFMFFEQQMEELTEDFGLGGKKMKFWECNQMPGEIIYIPAATIMTSLNIHDAFSYKQSIATSAEAVISRVNSNIWSPESGMIPGGYQFGACFDGKVDLTGAGSMLQSPVNPMQAQIIEQIMSQYYQGDKARNMLMLSILSECAAVMSAPGLDSDNTYCKQAWPQCTKQLEKNSLKMGQSVPAWLTGGAPSKCWGKAEL